MKTKALDIVAKFYKGKHFNGTENIDSRVRSIIETNVVKDTYTDLHYHLKSKDHEGIIELGCGTGWLSCSIARYYNFPIIGIDYSSEALRLAESTWVRIQELDRNLFLKKNNKPIFLRSDIRNLPEIHSKISLVSLGALHHTEDTYETIDRVLDKCDQATSFYIGLYHFPSRGIFLDFFKEFTGDRKYEKFKSLFGDYYDEVHIESWYRDQLLHVRESSHSILSLSTFMESVGFRLISTSLNQFKTLPMDIRQLDLDYSRWVQEALSKSVFMPGFFTALFEREII